MPMTHHLFVSHLNEKWSQGEKQFRLIVRLLQFSFSSTIHNKEAMWLCHLNGFKCLFLSSLSYFISATGTDTQCKVWSPLSLAKPRPRKDIIYRFFNFVIRASRKENRLAQHRPFSSSHELWMNLQGERAFLHHFK